MKKKTTSLLLIAALSLTVTNSALGFCFDQAGKKYNLSPMLLKAISLVESNGDPKAVNRSNRDQSLDYGLMQINSWWIKTIGMDRWMALGDPCYNAMMGAWILRQCIDQFGYGIDGLGCYNAGTGKTKKSYKLRAKYARKVISKLKKLQEGAKASYVTKTPTKITGSLESSRRRQGSPL